ncbi:MAG: hypothetical protein G01um10142_104 [Parcubacteria group bacterium Gr01-1014_2]|nr:MAG: hypothetical protein G01um10142_104 [Parcubacteria group bacterium Gr01-1014_2]
MGGLIKLILTLILLTGLAVYGGDIWSGIKDKVAEFTNPEIKRANILDSFKNKFGEIESIMKEINENIDNPSFDKKAVLEKGLKIIGESKSKLNEIRNSDESLIEKTFETLNDLKQGTQNLFSDSKKGSTQNNQCPPGNE